MPKLYTKANQLSFDKIANLIKLKNINCDFKRANSFVNTDNIYEITEIEKEKYSYDKSILNYNIVLPFI